MVTTITPSGLDLAAANPADTAAIAALGKGTDASLTLAPMEGRVVTLSAVVSMDGAGVLHLTITGSQGA